MAFDDILWTQGTDNMSGTVGNIFYVPVEDIDFTTPPTLNADGVTITGNITLLTGKKWFQIYHTMETGKLEDKLVGERDGKSYENSCEFKFPGDTKDLVAFKREVKNTPVVVAIRDRQGAYRLLGISIVKDGSSDELTLDSPAYIEQADGTTGQKIADARGHTFVVKSAANHPPLFYEGTFDIT